MIFKQTQIFVDILALTITNRIAANSLIRRMLGKLMQDPHDEDFEEGDLNVEQPVYGPTLKLISKIYGETRTVVVSFSFHANFLMDNVTTLF